MKELYVRHYDFDTSGRVKFRAVLASDIHEEPPEEIIRAVLSAKPDVIFIAGDLFETGNHYISSRRKKASPEHAYEFLRRASAAATVYYGVGNHDAELTDEMRRNISSLGVVLLENGCAEIKGIGGSVPCLVGGTTIFTDEEWLSDFSRRQGFKILLCHKPEQYMREIKKLGLDFDIVMAGHAHGGQWRFFGQGVIAAGQGLFPRWTRGFYGDMLVSAGAANSVCVPRFFNPCEIDVIDFA
ncbi:MAG: metallophosphoesterase [Firmicutes bacterium]|nr:metallophosphoesterase [Bacillota bacterium]